MRYVNGKQEDEQHHHQRNPNQDLLENLQFQWNNDQKTTDLYLTFQRSKRDDADVLVERHGNRDGVVADGLSC
jgi:hypothetical protein